MTNFYDYSEELPIHAKYMQNYLVKKCEGCTEAPCLDYHQDQTPRRVPVLQSNNYWNYRPILCSQENCKYGSTCRNSHSLEEVQYHPLSYKTKNCEKNQDHCPVEECPYAHGDLRLRRSYIKSNIFNYSTFKINVCTNQRPHNFETCNDYHDLNDKRRDPRSINYSFSLCQNRFCRDTFCLFSQNNTELLFHPVIYKTQPCTFRRCRLENFCPFLHGYEITSKEKSIQNDEISALKNSYELLEEILRSEEAKKLEQKKFMCFKCGMNASCFIFSCGHLVCEACSEPGFCEACGNSFPLVLVKD